jgi:hypothetical protein
MMKLHNTLGDVGLLTLELVLRRTLRQSPSDLGPAVTKLARCYHLRRAIIAITQAR